MSEVYPILYRKRPTLGMELLWCMYYRTKEKTDLFKIFLWMEFFSAFPRYSQKLLKTFDDVRSKQSVFSEWELESFWVRHTQTQRHTVSATCDDEELELKSKPQAKHEWKSVPSLEKTRLKYSSQDKVSSGIIIVLGRNSVKIVLQTKLKPITSLSPIGQRDESNSTRSM